MKWLTFIEMNWVQILIRSIILQFCAPTAPFACSVYCIAIGCFTTSIAWHIRKIAKPGGRKLSTFLLPEVFTVLFTFCSSSGDLDQSHQKTCLVNVEELPPGAPAFPSLPPNNRPDQSWLLLSQPSELHLQPWLSHTHRLLHPRGLVFSVKWPLLQRNFTNSPQSNQELTSHTVV